MSEPNGWEGKDPTTGKCGNCGEEVTFLPYRKEKRISAYNASDTRGWICSNCEHKFG